MRLRDTPRLRQLRGELRAHHHRKTSQGLPDPDKHPWKYAWVVFKWRVSLATVAYPVQIALVIALVLVAIPTFLVLEQQGQIQSGRRITVGIFCRSLNHNGNTTNAEADYIKALIVSGAKQSKVFEPIYRQYHAPPYEERVKQAEQQAAKLDGLKVSPLNCKKLVHQVSEGVK
jgi:hypothetical protein